FPQTRVVLTTLKRHLDEVGPRQIDIRDVEIDQRSYGPDDPDLMVRLESLMRNETQITVGTTALANIQPFSMSFSIQIANLVSTSDIQRGSRPALLVYWHN